MLETPPLPVQTEVPRAAQLSSGVPQAGLLLTGYIPL